MNMKITGLNILAIGNISIFIFPEIFFLETMSMLFSSFQEKIIVYSWDWWNFWIEWKHLYNIVDDKLPILEWKVNKNKMIIQFDNLRLWKYMSYYLIHNKIGNHIFLSIRSKTIDLLLCLWCPNDCINHLEMIDSFTARTTNNLVQKGWTQFLVLYSCNFNCYFVVSRGKTWPRLNHPFFT